MTRNITVGFGLNPFGKPVWLVDPDIEKILAQQAGTPVFWNLMFLGDFSQSKLPPLQPPSYSGQFGFIPPTQMSDGRTIGGVTFLPGAQSGQWPGPQPAPVPESLIEGQIYQYQVTLPSNMALGADYEYIITVQYQGTLYPRDPEFDVEPEPGF